MSLFLKIVISAVIIGAIAEVGRRNSNIAALLAALPLVSLLGMIWMYQETHDVARIAAFSWSVFWYVVPSLILFVLLPVLLTKFQMPFYVALPISCAATIAGFFALSATLRVLGITI
jgi:hypothetical protein